MTTPEEEWQKKVAQSRALRLSVPQVSGDVIKKVREDLGMDQNAFAQMLGVSPETVAEWEKRIRPTTNNPTEAPLANTNDGLVKKEVPKIDPNTDEAWRKFSSNLGIDPDRSNGR